MSEKKRKMCELESPISPSLSISIPPSPAAPLSSTLQLQFHPNTPKIAHYTPKVLKRMETDICFSCKQQGHWSLFCPLKNSSTSSYGSNYPKIWCRCGHGFCEEKTVISNNNKNKGRKYYVCPIKRGKKCKDFVKWCDADNINESDFRPPMYKYPECVCGAGVCRKEEGTGRPYGSEYYFACPIKESHGSCGYRVWEDELLDNNKGNLLSKRMRVMDNSDDTSLMVICDLREREDASLNAAPSKSVGFSDLEVADYLQDLEFANSLSWDEEEPFLLSRQSTPSRICGEQNLFRGKIFAAASFDFGVADYLQDLEFANSVSWDEDEPFLLSRQSTPSRICGQQNLFQGSIFAAASLGHCPMGWLGRFLFFYPTQSLKFPPPQPFFCCVFPSSNPIDVPKQVSIGDGLFESSQLADNSLSQQAQIATACDTDASRDAVTPNKSPASERKPLSKAERQRQVVLFAQQQLLINLETSDPKEHESMREAAEATFDMLDNLGVNYKQFSQHVWDYIDLASSMAEMDKSMENSLTLDEYNKRFEEEQVRFARIQRDCFNTETLLEASNQRRQSLIGEISHLKAMLCEKQTQLKSCELENLQRETNLGDLRSLMEADATLEVTAADAKVAWQLNEDRQAKQIAAKTALEMAKLELDNV